MNRKKIKAVLVTLLLFVITTLSFHKIYSAVATGMNYQGRYKEAGSYITGTRAFRFRITDEAGTVKWTSKIVDLSLDRGMFNYVLHCSTAVVWESVTPYVEVLVGPAGSTLDAELTVLTPREKLQAGAYAYYISSTTYSQRIAAGTGGGAADKAAKFTAALTLGDSIIQDNGTNAGISVAPDSRFKLQVDGSNIRVKDQVYIGSEGTMLNGTNQGGSIELGPTTGSGQTPYIDFHYGKDSFENYNVRVINDADGQLTFTGDVYTTGKFGMALTTPSDALDLGSNYLRLGTASDYQRLSGNTYGVSVIDDDVADGVLRLGEVWGAMGLFSGDSGAYDLNLCAPSGKAVAIGANNTSPLTSPGLYVASDNKVGIGTTDPGTYKVKVSGTANFSSTLTVGTSVTAAGYVKSLSEGVYSYYETGTSDVWNNTVGNTMLFRYEAWNLGGWNDANTEYSAPVAGYYLFASLVTTTPTEDMRFICDVYVNGTATWRDSPHSSIYVLNAAQTGVLHLNANDHVIITVDDEDGGANYSTIADYATFMTLFLLKAD
ncbi:MAG: hypothetical protein WC955_01015 [Elusimicrobiota bacterium]